MSVLGHTAVAGGVVSVVNGGKFGHGFVSAGVSVSVAPALGNMNTFGGTVVSAIVGGTVSEMTGGKFANGAATAAFSFAVGRMATSRKQVAQSSGEPDSAIEEYRRNSSLRRAISVVCRANDCAIELTFRVMGDYTITDETFQYALDDIRNYWTTAVTYGERTYGIEVNLSVVQINPDIIIAATAEAVAGQAPVGAGRVLQLGMYRSGTAAHELGHLMGLGHQMNHTLSIMSYSDVRIVTGYNAAKLTDLYGRPR